MIWGRSILRAHGSILAVLGAMLFGRTLVGRFQGTGMFSFLASNHVAAIGFAEAYGLIALTGVALVLGAGLPRPRALHILAAGIHAFLTAINLSNWRFYAVLGMQGAGYGSTAMHVVLATVELACAVMSSDALRGKAVCDARP